MCLATSAYYYVAPHADNIAGTRAMTLGDIVLTPGFNIGMIGAVGDAGPGVACAPVVSA